MILSSFWRRILGMSDTPKVLDALGAATAAQGLLAASALQRTDIIYGSNANGQYWRVPDSSGSGGLQICIGSTDAQTTASAYATGLFYNNTPCTATFAAAFSAAPQVIFNANRADGNGAARLTGSSVLAHTATGIAGLRSISTVNTHTVDHQYIAIGRYT